MADGITEQEEVLSCLVASLCQAVFEAHEMLIGVEDMQAMHAQAVLAGAIKEMPPGILALLAEGRAQDA